MEAQVWGPTACSPYASNLRMYPSLCSAISYLHLQDTPFPGSFTKRNACLLSDLLGSPTTTSLPPPKNLSPQHFPLKAKPLQWFSGEGAYPAAPHVPTSQVCYPPFPPPPTSVLSQVCKSSSKGLHIHSELLSQTENVCGKLRNVYSRMRNRYRGINLTEEIKVL